jgi:hypothetical protein
MTAPILTSAPVNASLVDLARAGASARRIRLLELVNAAWTTQAIATAVELCVADFLADAPCSVEALANAAGCPPQALRRLLCALASLDVVVQRDDDTFALTAMGALLRADAPDSVAAWALLCGRRIWDNWRGLADSVRTGRSGKMQAGGSDDFTHLAGDHRTADLFHRAMISVTHAVAAAVATRIDFAGVNRLVDIGGGHGCLLGRVLTAHPQMRGVLFDLEHAASAAEPTLVRMGVRDRVEIVSGSFFDGIPGDADAYLLKSVLHDWDDEHCAAILRRCRRAMAGAMVSAARMLVIERIAPERFATSVRDQAIARSDLNMLVSLGGCERSEADYRRLLASEGLRVARIDPLPGEFSVIQAVIAD